MKGIYLRIQEGYTLSAVRCFKQSETNKAGGQREDAMTTLMRRTEYTTVLPNIRQHG